MAEPSFCLFSYFLSVILFSCLNYSPACCGDCATVNKDSIAMEPITMEPLPFEDFVFNNILPEEPPRDGESGDDFDCSLSTPPKENMQPSPAGSGGKSSGKKIL